MTEDERLSAVSRLRDWGRKDKDIGIMIGVVLGAENQPSIGHLARFMPEVFDNLYEEMEAMRW